MQEAPDKQFETISRGAVLPSRWSGRASPPQAEAEADPARTGENEVNAEEEAKNVEAIDGPMDEDNQSEEQCDPAGHGNPDPRRAAPYV